MEGQAKAGCGANSIEHSYLEAPDTVRSAVDWLSTAPMEHQSCTTGFVSFESNFSERYRTAKNTLYQLSVTRPD
jgi:hypothetical protein